MIEYIDIVSNEDEVIEVVDRRELGYNPQKFFRVVNGFIMNDHGEYFIPIRSVNKTIFPLCFDTSVGGHVMSGESYHDAFIRETYEETGLDLQEVKYIDLGKYHPVEHKLSAFMHLYVIHSNEIPRFNLEEFSGFFWATPDKIRALLKDGHKFKRDFDVLFGMLG